jgi:hypothetical protein
MEIDNELISNFLTGTLAVFAMVAIGGALANLFSRTRRNHTFTRSALILILPPLCLSLCLPYMMLQVLFPLAAALVIIGFALDGAKQLIIAGKRAKPKPDPLPPEQEEDAESDGRTMRWEKAE